MSCHFRYPSIRGFCPMCGSLPSAESAALEIIPEPKGRGLEIHRRTAAALRTFSAGHRRLIPVVLSTVVLICIAAYFGLRSRQTTNSPGVVPGVVGKSPQPNLQSTAAPMNVSQEEVESVRLPKPPQPEESSKTTSENPADLWSRVRKGDAEAEVALAKLYLSGVGVERSCEQAHVLLSAASRKQNKAADDLLAGDYSRQCP